jgi:hypothetical protein
MISYGPATYSTYAEAGCVDSAYGPMIPNGPVICAEADCVNVTPCPMIQLAA